eukprot:2387873-Amphidinium_carterae.1
MLEEHRAPAQAAGVHVPRGTVRPPSTALAIALATIDRCGFPTTGMEGKLSLQVVYSIARYTLDEAWKNMTLGGEGVVIRNDSKVKVMTTAAFHTAVAAATTAFVGTCDVTSKDEMAALLGKAQIGRGLLGAISTKLNWYSTNHHVGQSTWEGFSCKVWSYLMGMGGGTSLQSSSPLYNVAWACGHFCSTRGVLAYICRDNRVLTENWTGCDGPNSEIADQYEPTADIILRANQPPAGTRAVLNLLTAAKQLAVSPYGFLVPAEVISSAAMNVDVQKVVKYGMCMHVGKTYLTAGQPTPQDAVAMTQVDEEVSNWVGHY